MAESERIEAEFASLLASGWTEPVERKPQLNWLFLVMATHQIRMADQLVNSAVPETRAFWRSTPLGKAILAEQEGLTHG